MTAAATTLQISVAEDFDDTLARGAWDTLVGRGTDVVFLTYDWQRTWWECFGSEREHLLIVCAQQGGTPVAIAPMFATKEMLCLIGSDGSDYLDFIGSPEEETMVQMLQAARQRLPEFAGVAIYHLPLSSPTTRLLPGVAARMGLQLHRGEEMSAPYADLTDPERVRHLTARRTLRKSQARMRRAGPLRMRHATEADLDAWVELFLAQHDAFWAAAGQEGLRRDEARAFCRAIVRLGTRRGWLGFMMLQWREQPVAFEITLIHANRHLSYLGSRDASIEYYSPGAVLQGYVVQDALASGARCYDFGLGEESYKLGDASGATRVASWFLYPP